MRLFRWQLLIAVLATILVVVVLGMAAAGLKVEVLPDKGGVLTEGVVGNPQTINPILAQYNQVDADLSALIFSGLTRLNERGEVVPDLAERWEISGDGLEYTFYLRQDVQWHDGAPFSSRDVVFTVKSIQHQDYQGVPYLARFWRDISVLADDDYTVRFILPEPLAPFLDHTTIGMLPAHLLIAVEPSALGRAEFNVQPVGTGRFQVAEASAQHLRLVPNSRSFGGPVYLLEALEFRFYPDASSLLEGYRRGEILAVSRVYPELIPQAAAIPTLDLYSARLSGHVVIYLNLNDAINLPYLQQREVRQALLHALDRQSLIDTVVNGQGLVADSPMMPETWAFGGEIQRYRYDPQRADELLDAAGWLDLDGDGVRENEDQRLDIRIVTNDDPTRQRLAEAVAAAWRQVGVGATAEVVSFARLVGEFLAPRRFDAILTGLEFAGDPDPYPLWHSSQIEGQGQNYGNFALREADEIMEEARMTSDLHRRIELYHRFQELFSAEVPALLLYHPVYTYGVDESVGDVQILPMNRAADRFATVQDWYVQTKQVLFGRTISRKEP
jgi:peptide/nickel transport system substrate-binding protein